MKALMIPHWLNIKGHEESGIKRVVQKYTEHLPAAGIELVNPKAISFDLLAVHAGMSKDIPTDAPLVSMLHGMYWSADYPAADWEYKVNRTIVDALRYASAVTVPSAWVAEPFQRDMHLNPYVVPHGIDWEEWQHKEKNEGYILGYAKNRAGSDVCNPMAMGEMAKRFPKHKFLGTFAPPGSTPNVKATGLVSHIEMRKMVQRSAVMMSVIKETFGVLHLEAMASGVPVLGFRHGGILDTVIHGTNGYLAAPGDYDDLARGLDYCLEHRKVLGDNGREMAKRFTWQRVAEQLAGIYQATIDKFHEPPTVSVVIPAYNYGHTLERAVQSVLAQTMPATEVIIVNNNSSDDTESVGRNLAAQHDSVTFHNCPQQGVAHTRNHGIRHAAGKYIICLDADDAIEPNFVESCVRALEGDRSLGVAYTRLRWIKGDGSTGHSAWPGPYVFDDFLRRKNQVPTCAMFRRELWQRLGGYRQRYAPMGAGAEDAEFFLRAGAAGFGAKLVSEESLFVYSWGTGRVSGDKDYKEPDWLAGKPWVDDKQHPFASLATTAKLSHPVRQYDEPVISVVIPCGPNHEQHLIDALDSLESQTFRKWEAIVTFDTGKDDYAELLTAYPFVRPVYTNKVGAGAARNAGAKIARGRYLLFLDADDWLKPTALQRLLATHNETGAIAYSDYLGHAYIEDKAEIGRLRARGRLSSYNDRTKEATVVHQSFDYDCARAVRQPEINGGEFYIWNLISSLVPKAWHDEIGGFDESMVSWEDWDYWLRLARRGKCFERIAESLVEYRFYTGTRRETGRQNHKSLLEYMSSKYKEQPMPCGSCGGRRSSPPAPAVSAQAMQAPIMQMSSEQIVWVRLNDGNHGDHNLGKGVVTRTDYGYRKHGDLFKMAKADAAAKPHVFMIVPDPQTVQAHVPAEPKETPAPQPVNTADFATWETPAKATKRKAEKVSA